MNIFYSPTLTVDPIFCAGTEVRTISATAVAGAPTQVFVPPSLPDGSYGNSVYLPGVNITFASLLTDGPISFKTSGFPPYTPGK
jgi:hypothetical protein